MRPDSEFAGKEQAAFDQLEAELRAKMTEEDKRQARTKALDLLKLQSETEDASCLPTLKVG
jgi:Zn-dependent M16 (insulinase) family peptidase